MKEELIKLIEQVDDSEVLALIYYYAKGLINGRSKQND